MITESCAQNTACMSTAARAAEAHKGTRCSQDPDVPDLVSGHSARCMQWSDVSVYTSQRLCVVRGSRNSVSVLCVLCRSGQWQKSQPVPQSWLLQGWVPSWARTQSHMLALPPQVPPRHSLTESHSLCHPFTPCVISYFPLGPCR